MRNLKKSKYLTDQSTFAKDQKQIRGTTAELLLEEKRCEVHVKNSITKVHFQAGLLITEKQSHGYIFRKVH